MADISALNQQQQAISQKMVEQRRESGDKQAASTSAQMNFRNAQEAYGQAQGRKNVAEQEARQTESDVKVRQQEVDGNKTQGERAAREIKDLKSRFDQQNSRYQETTRLAKFYKEVLNRNMRQWIEKTQMQMALEARNNWGELCRAMHASTIKFAAALSGANRPPAVSSAIESSRYYMNERPPDSEKGTSEQYEQRMISEGKEVAAADKQIQKKEKDPYWNQKLSESKNKLAKGKSDRKSALAKLENTRHSAESMKKQQQRARQQMEAAQKAGQVAQNKGAELQNEQTRINALIREADWQRRKA